MTDIKRLVAARGQAKGSRPDQRSISGEGGGKFQRLPRINIRQFDGNNIENRAVALETATGPKEEPRKNSMAVCAQAVSTVKKQSPSAKCIGAPGIPA
ncbi:uncharacterized protein LOC126370264 isoform X3 [Pectinophora gossypiella]|uniref:uncharacterized protein LOC126370264 isoform X3 n=1 Tax=Pectinophora gossypiella TaxID=13191 RepID=UPI00214E2FEE|nr:uncharacterized protein LOC126370264 isoform X3 [Pectinophora gossypiella]